MRTVPVFGSAGEYCESIVVCCQNEREAIRGKIPSHISTAKKQLINQLRAEKANTSLSSSILHKYHCIVGPGIASLVSWRGKMTGSVKGEPRHGGWIEQGRQHSRW